MSYEPVYQDEQEHVAPPSPKKNLSIKMPNKEFKSANTIGAEEDQNHEVEKMKSTIRADDTVGDMTRKHNAFIPDSPSRITNKFLKKSTLG